MVEIYKVIAFIHFLHDNNLRNPINYLDDVITDDVYRMGIKELCVPME